MPVIRAAVCPHPPLLVPEVATGSAGDLDDLRALCLAAVESLASANRILVVGTGPDARYDQSASGSFAPYGAPGARVGEGTPVLPLSLAVGAWLIGQTSADRLPRSYLSVPAELDPARCLALGQELAADSDRIGLLVMGDGSPRRSEHSPVHLHPRAEVFDTTVAAALGAADAVTLAALDPDLATELKAVGRAPWQVLAGALNGLHGDLKYHAAPYGVGYFVAEFS